MIRFTVLTITITIKPYLNKYHTILQNLEQQIPDLLQEEGRDEELRAKEAENNLEIFIDRHRFKDTFNVRKDFSALVKDKVPNMEDILKQTRISLKESVKTVGKNKDFSKEIKSIRDRIQNLRVSQQDFIQKKKDAIQRWANGKQRR